MKCDVKTNTVLLHHERWSCTACVVYRSGRAEGAKKSCLPLSHIRILASCVRPRRNSWASTGRACTSPGGRASNARRDSSSSSSSLSRATRTIR